MTNKAKNRKIERRLMRRREKHSDIKQEKMIGACCKRSWGSGIAR